MSTREPALDRTLTNTRLGAFQRYPRNAWYVAAGCSEIGNQPLGRLLLDVPVVLFRRKMVAWWRCATPVRIVATHCRRVR